MNEIEEKIMLARLSNDLLCLTVEHDNIGRISGKKSTVFYCLQGNNSWYTVDGGLGPHYLERDFDSANEIIRAIQDPSYLVSSGTSPQSRNDLRTTLLKIEIAPKHELSQIIASSDNWKDYFDIKRN